MLKTVLMPGFKARNLGIACWYSTNSLRNCDAEVLDSRASFGSEGESKDDSIYSMYPSQLRPELYRKHDLFIQHDKLKNTLRWLMGEEQIHHLGIEYYEKA